MTNTEFRHFIATVVFDTLKRNNYGLTNKELYMLVGRGVGQYKVNKDEKYKSGINKFQNTIQFGLLGLKKMGLVKNIERGVWAITPQGGNKPSLSVNEYADFQKQYWNEEISKKRKENIIKTNYSGMSTHHRSKLSKEECEILQDILDQNRQILNYIMGKPHISPE